MFDQADWYRRVRWFTCGDTTFEEAFRKTGRIFCVTLSATSKKAPPVLINYITAPNVVIASAVLASAAVPGKSNLLLLYLVYMMYKNLHSDSNPLTQDLWIQ